MELFSTHLKDEFQICHVSYSMLGGLIKIIVAKTSYNYLFAKNYTTHIFYENICLLSSAFFDDITVE